MVIFFAALVMSIASGHLLVIPAQSMDGKPDKSALSGPPPTPRAVLQLHHVALDSDSLIAALKNADPLVRGVAAGMLAEDKETAAIPSIRMTLEGERNQQTRINIASALAELGDNEGTAALRSICLNTSALDAFRLEAAIQLRPYSRDCVASVKDIAWSSSEPDVRLGAMSQLQQDKESSPEDQRSLLALEVHALDDPNPTIRMVAADGLAKTGDPLVLPLLRKKMESETDEIVKSDMSRDIEALARAIPK
jgi:HEAT repeat protein